MALTVSQQFNKFVVFASGEHANGMDTIARAGDAAPGNLFAGRAIREADGDALRKLFRGDDLQRENNLARKLFRQSVVDIFGGESQIPASVKEAMKLKDYEQGKPLTVRRILAVKAAIDVYAARAAEALDRAKAAATAAYFYGRPGAPVSPEKRARIDRVLTVAVNAAVTDTDALDVDGIVITLVAAGDALSISADIGEPPAEGRADFAELLLEASLQLDAFFAKAPESGNYVVVRRLALSMLENDAFDAALEALVNQAETWRRLLADFRPAAKAAAEAAEEEPSFGAGGFVQV